jgi:hypothetical protein
MYIRTTSNSTHVQLPNSCQRRKHPAIIYDANMLQSSMAQTCCNHLWRKHAALIYAANMLQSSMAQTCCNHLWRNIAGKRGKLEIFY